MQKFKINDDWEFVPEFSDDILSDLDVGAERVRIPHTVVETPFHYFDESIYQMVSGYRRVIDVPQDWQGKRVFVRFEAVAHSAYVYMNGSLVGEHHSGYTEFRVELTDYLKFGEDNILAVKVDSRESQNIPPFGFVIDYMTYGGIYREVSLEVLDSSFIEDVFVIPQVPDDVSIPGASELGISDEEYRLAGLGIGRYAKPIGQWIEDHEFDSSIRCQISIDDGNIAPIDLSSVDELASERNTNRLASDEKIRVTVRDIELYDDEADAGQQFISQEEFDTNDDILIPVKGVRLWDIYYPKRYEVTIELLRDGEVIDSRVEKVGFRTGEFRLDGYFLNGRRLQIRGLNRHQCYAYVGYAMPESLQRDDVHLLKKLGVDTARSSHYPQSHYFYDECDKIGMLNFVESPGWQHIGDDEWKAQVLVNIREMVVQYRNHPSIFIWGVRINESLDDDALNINTNKIAHSLDPTRQTGGVRNIKNSNLLEDVYTYNEFVHTGDNIGVDKKSDVTSDMSKPYLITEYNGHMYPTKPYDDEEHRQEHAVRHLNVLNDAMAQSSEISGCIAWCMFDYNTHQDFGAGDRICYHGVTDMFRNHKLAAKVYSSFADEPFVEVSSTMDIGEHPAGDRGVVLVFTNGDSIKLYKNGEFSKEYFREPDFYPELPYAPIPIRDFIGSWGERLTIFRFDAIKDGEVIASTTRGPAKEIHFDVEVSHTDLVEADTYDVAAVRIRMLDQYDNVIPFFNEPIFLEATGPISIIGPQVTNLLGGMGGTYIKTDGQPGEGKLRIISPQAEPVEIGFSVTV